MLVQLFYAWRILVLVQNYWVVSVIVILSLTSGRECHGTVWSH